MRKNNELNSGSFDNLNFEHFPCFNMRLIDKEKRLIFIFAFLFTQFILIIIDYRVAIIFFVIISLIYILLYQKKKKELMNKFIESNGLEYQDSISINEVKGNLFKTNYSAKIRNVIVGKYKDKDARFFYFNYTVQQGKNTITYSFTVLEIFFKNVQFPYMHLLYGKRLGPISSFPRHGKKDNNEREFSLENEFRKNFKLYIKEGYGIEAMQIFSKDFLQFLINEKCDFNIELNQDRMYIFERKLIGKTEEVKELFDTAGHLIDKIDPLMDRLGKDFHVLHDAYSKKYN